MRKDELDPKTAEEDSFARKTVSRREFLKYAGVAGAAVGLGGGLGGLLAACGGDEETTTTAGGATTTTMAGETTTSMAGETTTTMAGPEPPTEDKILIGAARPISGVNAIFEEAHFGPAYKLWAQTVNEAGGIVVAGKPLPVEMLVYDDQSDLDQSMRLLTKLMEEDKVNFVFSPCSTAFMFAAAGVINAHGYIGMSAEGGATTLEAEMAKGALPWWFQFLNYSNHYQMPVMAEIMAEVGATSAASMYIDDLHGIEYSSQAQIFFESAGIKMLSQTAVPPGIKDVSSILKQIQDQNPDVVCSFQYPPENILTISTMMQTNYNPNALLVGPGGSTQAIFDIWEGAADQMMFEGAWTYEQNADVKAYYDQLADFVGGPANVDFWGALIYKAELDFFQQAIEQAATLDQTVIAEVMRTAHFKTLMSDDTFMTNQILDRSSYAGQIGQWQNSIPQVIDPGDKRTAPPIYPKQPWPMPAAS
jgi:branched-chain amino acid transport system substrate-binding protein